MKGQIVGMVVDENREHAPGVEMMECAVGQDGPEMDAMVIWEKPEKDMSAQRNLRVTMVRFGSTNSFISYN